MFENEKEALKKKPKKEQLKLSIVQVGLQIRSYITLKDIYSI